MRSVVVGTFFVLLFFVYGFYVSQSDVRIIPSEIEQANPPGYYDYKGIANVQTNLSQGSSSPTEVATEALKTDLDFLILTDVNPVDLHQQLNSYFGKLLVMSEAEYSFLDSRVIFISDSGPRSFSSPSDINLFMTDILSQPAMLSRDGIAVHAHPFDRGSPTWTGSYPTGLQGLEILNPKAIAGRAWANSKLDVLFSSLFYFFNSRYAFLRLFREPHEELSLWDKISEERPFLGFAGANASARAVPLADYLIKFPSYQKSLEVVGNHVILPSELTGNYQKDRAKIVKALKVGQFYFSVDLLGNPKGFNVVVNDGEKSHLMGARIPMKAGLKLQARLGREPEAFYEIVLIKNGQREKTENSPSLDFEIKEPGTYRIIVRVSPLFPLPDAKKWITWIYSNPFFIGARPGL